MNRWLKRTLLGVVPLVLVIAVALLIPKPPIPKAVKDQVSSTLLMPKQDQVKISRDSAKFDSSLKLLTYTATAFGSSLVVSEQPTPDSFVDIPQVYDKVVTSMGEYESFDVDVGTVHLTRPKDLGGRQAAVLNTKGTLMFVKPASDLSDDDWRRFFGSLTVIK